MRELAFRYFPHSPCGNYREYTAEELKDPKKVETLFDLCQILEAYITAEGWHFLIAQHGFQNLYEIDKKSGWFDEDTLEEFVMRICGQIEDAEILREKDKAEYESFELQSTPEAIRDLKAYAESKGMSPQALIRTALAEYRHTRGELHTPLYLINFYPEKSEFFSLNCAAEERFGYRINPDALPLSPETQAEIRALYQDYKQKKERYRDPKDRYAPPDIPPEVTAFFNQRADALYKRITAELGPDYQITEAAQWF
ncbi:MAG: hypothetical protein IJM46_14995 [Oscillospiraceae bacterium]|nr:hypothetical protein [Oscillospiraceae bacterium]